MIARIWHGSIRIGNFEAYTAFLRRVAIPDYKKTEGFIKLVFLRRTEGNFGCFTLITFWENLDVIREFAGENINNAKYYPEDNDYLLKFEKNVVHFDVFADE